MTVAVWIYHKGQHSGLSLLGLVALFTPVYFAPGSYSIRQAKFIVFCPCTKTRLVAFHCHCELSEYMLLFTSPRSPRLTTGAG